MPAAVDAHLKVFPMKACADQCDGGGRRYDELEEGDGAVGISKYLDAPEIEQEIDHDQDRRNGQTRTGQHALAVGRMDIQRVRPVTGPGTHVLHRRLGLHGNHRDDGDPSGPEMCIRDSRMSGEPARGLAHRGDVGNVGS